MATDLSKGLWEGILNIADRVLQTKGRLTKDGYTEVLF